MNRVYPSGPAPSKPKRRPQQEGRWSGPSLALIASLVVHAAFFAGISIGRPIRTAIPKPPTPQVRTVLQLEAPPPRHGRPARRFRDLAMPSFFFTEGRPQDGSGLPGAYDRAHLARELQLQALTNRRERPHRHVWDAYPEIEGGFRKMLNPW